MKKYKIIVLAMLACVSLKSWAQEEGNIAGKVVDKLGNPIEGVLISVENNPLVQATTDRNGKFEIIADHTKRLQVRTGRMILKLCL